MSAPVIERQHQPGAAPASRSAYPPRVAELVPKARELADRLGEVPSRNRLMSELRVGAPKASELRSALLDAAGSETAPPTAASTRPVPSPAPDRAPPNPAPAGPPRSTGPGRDPDPSPATPEPAPVAPDEAGPGSVPASLERGSGLATWPAHPDPGPAPDAPAPETGHRVPVWPVLLLAAPAFVAIWSGWVRLGSLTGFGIVHPLPGIWDSLTLNTAITLPIGVETYAAYALRAWLAPGVPARARRFARASAIGALCLGALGQIAYHLMAAANVTAAPWQITALVSCLPVAVLGMGAALIHLLTDPAAEGRIDEHH